MKHTNLKKCMAAIAAAAVMASAAPSMPAFSNAATNVNIITNSTFDSSSADWGTYKESGGACTLSAKDGKLALNITNVGKLNYAVQVFYDIVPLYQNGVYHLSYEISSTLDRTAEGMIQQNGGTYQSYTWKKLNLTSEPLKVDYNFTMEEATDIMAKLVFNCGTQGEDMPEHTIYIDNVVLELIDDSQVDYTTTKRYEPPIVLNQVGYKPSAEKIAVFREITDEKEFSVVNADTKKVVYTGELYGKKDNPSAGETDWFGDFTSVTEPGKYYITCGNLDNSYEFEIKDDIYSQLLDDSVRMLYLQRCGYEVQDTDFGHPSCHNSMATIYGTSEKIDVSGGWHDAGDYGRYVVPGAKAVADILYAYSANPSIFSDNIGIPESGNGVADVLDEARYELEWMLKMQDSNGGVHHKVSCATFPGFVMPQKETGELLVTPVTTTATADFCAAMAMAYEFYKDIDKTFSDKCLAAAEKAWSFLEQNPDFIYKNPADIVTGDYGDKSDKDERYWAAAQMYRATGSEKYLTALQGMDTRIGLDWTTVGDYGNIALMTMKDFDKSPLYNDVVGAVIKEADKYLSTAESTAYGNAIADFYWGSNMGIANSGIILSMAYNLTGNAKYINAAQSQVNYLLGKNAIGTSFVTGYGTVSPKNPHHRPSVAVGKAMKGMLVGGVDPNLEESAAKAFLKYEPADKCYIDNSESYSTNEITIYWNSPLTYLLALTDTKAEVVTPTDTTGTTAPSVKADVIGDANCDKKVDIADVVLVKSYLINGTRYSISAQGLANADVQETGNGLNSNDAIMIQQKTLGLIDF